MKNKKIIKPLFPIFKKLELDDRAWMEEYIQKFPPYSDFNFVSLWSWNVKNEAEVSVLNDNLIIKFNDYLSGDELYTFIGINNVINTIESLFDNQLGSFKELRLVPEIVINEIKEKSDKYLIELDSNNTDYLYCLINFVNLSGDPYRGKRNFLNRFNRFYPSSTTNFLDLNNTETQKEILNLFNKWSKNVKNDIDPQIELIALSRLFKLANSRSKKILSVGVKYKEQLIGFSICEILNQKYSLLHFEKADVSYVGVYEYLKNQVAKVLLANQCEYINFEQDLGLEGLRISKKSWKPDNYLKKFIIYKR